MFPERGRKQCNWFQKSQMDVEEENPGLDAVWQVFWKCREWNCFT